MPFDDASQPPYNPVAVPNVPSGSVVDATIQRVQNAFTAITMATPTLVAGAPVTVEIAGYTQPSHNSYGYFSPLPLLLDGSDGMNMELAIRHLPTGQMVCFNPLNQASMTTNDVIDTGFHMFSIAVDGANASFYVDGLLQASSTAWCAFSDSFGSTPINLTYNFTDTSLPMPHIDCLRVWNVALKPYQVLRAALTNLEYDEPHLAAVYDFSVSPPVERVRGLAIDVTTGGGAMERIVPSLEFPAGAFDGGSDPSLAVAPSVDFAMEA
jgi:hypothetical protein